MSKIAVLTSGGVDSSVALALLAERGEHELHAFYLKIWLEDELAFLGSCPWQEDLRYVREICDDPDNVWHATAGVPVIGRLKEPEKVLGKQGSLRLDKMTCTLTGGASRNGAIPAQAGL